MGTAPSGAGWYRLQDLFYKCAASLRQEKNLLVKRIETDLGVYTCMVAYFVKKLSTITSSKVEKPITIA
jgi:hypothetical protein